MAVRRVFLVRDHGWFGVGFGRFTRHLGDSLAVSVDAETDLDCWGTLPHGLLVGAIIPMDPIRNARKLAFHAGINPGLVWYGRFGYTISALPEIFSTEGTTR
jgi:hypothetical protein